MPVLFPYEPDWSRPYRVDHAFRTEVIVSRNKREQRIANRVLPRKTYEFSLRLSRGELAEFQGYMAKNQQGDFWLIDWTRFVASTADVIAGASTIELGSVPGWIAAGVQVYLKNGPQRALVQVASVNPTSITLTAPLVLAWPAGARVHHVVRAAMSQSIRARLLTNTVGTVDMSFTAQPGSFHESEPAAPTIFNGRELFLTKPNWATQPSVDLVGFLESVDFDRGVISNYAPVVFNTRRLQMSYLGRDRAAVESFLDVFRRAKGQRGEFYMPTWEPDIDVSIGAAPGATQITVPGSDFLSAYAGSPVYKALIIFHNDGSYQARRITSVVASGPNTRINVFPAWTTAVNAATVRLACLLPVWRFAVDNVSVEWLTNSVGQWQASVQTLEDLE